METALQKALLSDVRAFASNYRLFSIREQNKTVLKLFRSTIGWIDYDRFKQIVYFGAEPISDIETRFVEVQKMYLAVIHKGGSIVYDGGDRALSVFERICDEANRLPTIIDKVAHINHCLFDNDLVMLRFPLVQASTSLTPLFLLDYEFNSPKTTIAMDKLLRSSQDVDVFNFIKELLSKYPISNAFLFGSFAKGMAIIESDVDLAICFQKGFSENEKLEIIQQIKSQIEAGIGRRGDIVEVFDCGNECLLRELGIYKEVPLL